MARLLPIVPFLALAVPSAAAYTLVNDTCTFSDETCNDLPAYAVTAFLSQRDVTFNSTIDQQTSMGLNTSSALFEPFGYTSDGLASLARALKVGYRNLFVDAYWSQARRQWLICPEDVDSTNSDGSVAYTRVGSSQCQGNLTMTELYSTLSAFLTATDTNVAANILTLRMTLRRAVTSTPSRNSTGPSGVAAAAAGASALSPQLQTQFGQRLYTPANLTADRRERLTFDGLGRASTAGFPTVTEFLFAKKDRLLVFVAVEDSSLGYNYAEDSSVVFDRYMGVTNGTGGIPSSNGNVFSATNGTSTNNSNSGGIVLVTSSNGASNKSNGFFYLTSDKTPPCNATALGIYLGNVTYPTQLGSWQTLVESPDAPFTNTTIQQYTDCGFSMVVTRPLNTQNDLLTPIEQSFWSWQLGQPLQNSTTRPVSAQNKTMPVSYSCAAMDENGWFVANCYEEYLPLCQLTNHTYGFTTGPIPFRYFDAQGGCPNNSRFAVPRSALANTAALSQINVTKPVWIDLNSIAVTDCWVSGVDTQCPYHTISTNRNSVALLSTVVVVSFVLICISLLLRLDQVPIKKNQYRWRRLINQYSKDEFQGVPA